MDIVESRFVGMKSRGVYETPGGTVLMTARRAVESICLDRGELHLKARAQSWRALACRLARGAGALWKGAAMISHAAGTHHIT